MRIKIKAIYTFFRNLKKEQVLPAAVWLAIGSFACGFIFPPFFIASLILGAVLALLARISQLRSARRVLAG